MKGFTEVAPEELIINDFIQNCRSEEDEADVSDLVESIKERGLINPLRVRIARVTENGVKKRKYYLVAGFRRLRAILQLKQHDPMFFPTVPCTIFEGNETDALLDNLAENIDRRDLRPMDIAQRVVELKRMGVKIEVIASRVKKSIAYLYSLSGIYQKGTKEVRELFDEGKINLQDALSLKNLDNESQKKAAEEIGTASTKKEKREAVSKATGRQRMKTKKEIQEAVENIPVADLSKNGNLKGMHTALMWVLGEEAELPLR